MMATPHSSINEFFVSLASLFESRRKVDHGSIFLTQKRLTPPDASSSPSFPSEYSFADLNPTSPLPILIRATNGKSKEHRAEKIKISTIVEADKLEAFFMRYGEVCKAGMQGLKKRDRSAKKTKLKAKKKRKEVAIQGQVEKKG